MLRKVSRITTGVGLLAPFGGNWIAIVFFMLYVTGNSLWGSWATWVILIVGICWTIFVMIVQVVIAPKTFRWANTPPGTDPDTDVNNEDNDDNDDSNTVNDVDSFIAYNSLFTF